MCRARQDPNRLSPDGPARAPRLRALLPLARDLELRGRWRAAAALLEPATARFTRALQLAESSHDDAGAAEARFSLGLVHQMTNEPAKARAANAA